MARSGVNILNYIRENSGDRYQEVVPLANEDNLQEIGNVLFNEAYVPELNLFINNLINRIGMTLIHNKRFNNPLGILKKGSMPLGTDIQDIYTNPAEAQDYELSNQAMAKLLTITDPQTKVAYYRLNHRKKYKSTIAREALQNAFTSYDRFEKFINSIFDSLYSGAYIDEFRNTKRLISGGYANNKLMVKQTVKPIDEATSRQFAIALRTLFANFKYPSDKYNAYSVQSGDQKGVTTWSDTSRIVLVVRSDVLATVSVESLAVSFNMDKADFLGRVVEVDEFDDPNLLAVIADESLFQIYDQTFRFDQFYNAEVMAWNVYLHQWQVFALCPFANAVALTTAEPAPEVPVTGLSFGTTDPVSIAKGGQEGLDITTTPEDATTPISYEVTSAPDGGSVNDLALTTPNGNKNVRVTVAGEAVAGDYTLTAKAGEVEATVTITVTE